MHPDDKLASLAGPVPEGRVPLEGKVVSVKEREGHWGTEWKVVLQLPDGNRVWGTLPQSIIDEAIERAGGSLDRWTDAVRGEQLKLTATVTRSDNDEHFGFYKRPAKAQLVS